MKIETNIQKYTVQRRYGTKTVFVPRSVDVSIKLIVLPFKFFPKLYKVGSVGNNGEEQNNFSKKVTSSGDWTWDLLYSTLMLS